MTTPDPFASPPVSLPAGGDAPIPRTWIVELPAGLELLTSNQRSRHWGRPYRIGKAITDAAIVAARAARIPRLGRVRIRAVWHPPTKGRSPVRDTHNLAPTYKAAIDGIVRAGVLPDDRDEFVSAVVIEPGPKRDRGQFVLHLTEVCDAPGVES